MAHERSIKSFGGDVSTCAVSGCDSGTAFGARLCPEHLAQVDAAHSDACSAKDSDGSPYDLLAEEFMSRIGPSEQMRSLAEALVEGGVRNIAESFPVLAAIPEDVLEQLVSFLAVNVVSAVIQDRAHVLARASMLADALPPHEANGINKMIELELELLDGKSDAQ